MLTNGGNVRILKVTTVSIVFNVLLGWGNAAIVRDDLVKIDTDLVQVKSLYSYNSAYYTNDAINSTFACYGKERIFHKKVSWFFKTSSGVLKPVTDHSETVVVDGNITSILKLSFPSSDITEFFCRLNMKQTPEWFQTSLPVIVEDPVKPQIKSGSPSPTLFTPGMNLTCNYVVQPLREEMVWYRNDVLFESSHVVDNRVQPNLQHTIQLPEDQVESNVKYTCVISNFVGEDRKSFVVSK